ncbi:MAG: 16S rRNA (guanine(527)-N(7))-methyltransferase RsmG [Synechococcales cyanobacterium M58_A2018_015]|nr:16S rRNA (guanine(527)-N(7))-methyltransferase RsmG [Synechococcales cyanobacterium M58_A2018_015]
MSDLAAASKRLPSANELWQETLGWHPTQDQQAQFQRLYEQILAANQSLNLTRITEPADFWEKHLWDSLRGIQPWINTERSLRVIDIGTGGGFPGVPVALARPDWTVTLLDSTRKKINFLRTLVADLGLSQTELLVERAEQAGHLPQQRGCYDLALIRAVATATVCAEYALPLLKVGGTAVLYRGQWTTEEATALANAAQILGGTLDGTAVFTTPLSHAVRHCLYLKKQSPTPDTFPRPVGIPTQKPL